METLRSRRRLPPSRCSTPINTLNSVLLPAPFLPSMPIRSPRTIEASMPSKRVWRPKLLRALIRRIMDRESRGCRGREAPGGGKAGGRPLHQDDMGPSSGLHGSHDFTESPLEAKYYSVESP